MAVNRDPARLSVEPAPDAAGVALAPGVGIEIILDTSSSMRKKIGRQRRIDIAKASLRKLIGEALAEGVPVAMRTFGGKGNAKKARCDTHLALPLGPLDRAAAVRLTGKLKAKRQTATPIAAALAKVADDLAVIEGSRTVVLVTDGNETCGGDVDAVIATLRAGGIDIDLNIVGFALEDEALKAQMKAWADSGGGTCFDATGAAQLAASIGTAVSAPFRVYGPGDDDPVATGTVGAAPVRVEPGIYRVEVLTDPPVEFNDVVLDGGASLSLILPRPDARP